MGCCTRRPEAASSTTPLPRANGRRRSTSCARCSAPPTWCSWAWMRKAKSMLLLIDNYDSFTYNLAQYLGELGADVHVYRNDAVTVGEIAAWQPTHIVISAGHC